MYGFGQQAVDGESLFLKIFSPSRRFPYFIDEIFKILVEAKFVDRIKDLTYFDLGAGFGLMMIDGLLQGFNVYGTEPDPNSFSGRYNIAIRLAKEYGIDLENRLYSCSGENMYLLQKNIIDVIYSYQVLEHVSNIKAVLEETSRVLKLDGIAYFTMPNYNSFYEGHFETFWIPFILSKSKKISKIYLKLIRKKTVYVDELNFTTPLKIRKITEKIFHKDEIFIIPCGIKGLGFLSKYVYAIELYNFYKALKIKNHNDIADYLKKNSRAINKLEKIPFINIFVKLYRIFFSTTLLQPFITDFRLIIIRINNKDKKYKQ